jgi:DHA1 family multidrug resistance protein-like MFS transporter
MIRKVFPILALAIFCSMLGSGIVVPLLPIYAESMGASGIWLGIIFAAFSISQAGFMPLAGRLSDRHGRKLFLVVGLLVYALFSFAYIWANSITWLILLRLAQGAAGALVSPIAQAYIGDLSPQGEEGKWMGYTNAAFFAGWGIGPLLGGLLSQSLNMNAAFYTMGGLNLVACLLIFVMLREPVKRKIKTAARSAYQKIARSPVMQGISLWRFTYAIGMGAFLCFLPVYGSLELGMNTTETGILLTTSNLLLTVLQLFFGKVADRFNRRAIVIVGSLAGVAYLAMIPFTTGFWGLLGLCALGGIGGAMAAPAASALVVEQGRVFGMGATIAVFSMMLSAGNALGPVLSGAVDDAWGIGAAFYVPAALAFLGLVGFAVLARQPGKPVPVDHSKLAA